MADIATKLGSVSLLTVGTHTVYTVPTGKSARVKLRYRGTLANTGTILFTVGGIVVAAPVAAAGAEFIFSSTAALYENTGTTAPDGIAAATTVGEAPEEYYLDAGDTVSYSPGVVDLTAMQVDVVGIEIDKT